MDIKAIGQNQASLNMHIANTQINQEKIQATDSFERQDDIELFKKLNPQTQNDIIQKTIDELNEKMKMLNTSLRVEVDKDTGIQVIKIIDSRTKEVVVQLPPEAVLKIAKYIDEITGLLFEKKA